MTLRLGAALALVLALGACETRPDHLAVEDDLTDASWTLLDQDSTAFAFPDDLAGRPAYVTAVFTNCPDVCPMTMAQTQRIHDALGPTAQSVQFVALSFDPERDTPAALRRYADVWELGPEWRLATGDTTTVRDLMTRLGVRYREARRDTLASGRVYVNFSHSDVALLIDAEGRVVETYGGSAAPPDMVAQDVRDIL